MFKLWILIRVVEPYLSTTFPSAVFTEKTGFSVVSDIKWLKHFSLYFIGCIINEIFHLEKKQRGPANQKHLFFPQDHVYFLQISLQCTVRFQVELLMMEL